MNAREEIPITEEIMRYAKKHMDTEKPWMHGKPVKAYLDCFALRINPMDFAEEKEVV